MFPNSSGDQRRPTAMLGAMSETWIAARSNRDVQIGLAERSM
jgi:hypothetical protein